MKILTKKGIDKLIFGMKQADVLAIYGKPDKEFKDEDQNVIIVYNKPKFRLTFYADEHFKLGYIISSNENLQLSNNSIIGKEIELVKSENTFLKTWEIENFDFAENHFNQDNWLILVSEFGVVAKIELGAIIKDNDEFDWKF